MKRSRVKLAGLGLAILAGTANGAGGDWNPPQPSRVVPVTSREPQGLPPELVAQNEPPLVWFPAPSRLHPPTPAPGANANAQSPVMQASQSPPVEEPRTFVPPPPLRQPKVSQLPAVPPIPPAVDHGSPWDKIPPRPMPIPIAPPNELSPPTKLPDPEVPLALPPHPDELPVAPAGLMMPLGTPVPGLHGRFGSKPINLSRDYPSLAELHDWPFRHALANGYDTTLPAPQRGFVQAEYLMWWASALNIPILATTNTQGGFGFIGEPGTVPLLGPGEFIGPFRNGFRVRGGWWSESGCGLDGSFFLLGRKTATSTITSDEYPTIGRPIFAPNPGPGGLPIGEFVESVAFPGIITGVLTVQAESVIWGFDANIRNCLWNRCDSRASWFVGFRNVNLNESITITENITVVGNASNVPGTVDITSDPIGTMVVVQDRFATRNSFYGGQMGVTFERDYGRFTFDTRASLAFGVTHQELAIDGYQIRTRPGMPPMSFTGGLLAAGPNLGTFTRDQFSVLPELTFNVGYRLSPSLKAYVGYNVMYWNNVIRPGDQIDGVVDLTFVPNAPNVPPSGLNRPQPLFKQSDMWMTGVQFGMEWRW